MAVAADTVIVGAGAAGCVLARRLAERGDQTVLLLEAGPDLGGNVAEPYRNGWLNPAGADWTTDWGFESEPDATGATNKLRRGKLLGGTSWLTRFAVRGHPADFDSWGLGNPAWTFADVLPSFRRLESDADFGGRQWHGDHGPITINRYRDLRRSAIHDGAIEGLCDLGFPSIEDHNEPGAVGVGPMPMSTRNGRRITTYQAYLRAEVPETLTIRPEAQVDRVLLDGARAVGVRLVDGTEITAGAVILCAGTYGSPPMLLRSGIGPATDLHALGLEVVVDLPGVGQNLADHPGVDLDSGWRGKDTSAAPLHSIATFRSATQPQAGPPDMMFWLIDPAGNGGAFSLDPILLKPASRGSVHLRSADPLAAPSIRLPGISAGRDVERLMDGYRAALELANHPSVRRLATEPAPPMPASTAELRGRVRDGAYSNPHVVGTCRMGPSPSDGDVVDASGQVHGVDGLRVVDASVIPEPPSGFPHLITIMLAEHLSDAHPGGHDRAG